MHLGEWWLAGTDRTRHWMPTGIGWSSAHTDITNHFLLLGVYGGILLVCVFAAILLLAFAKVGCAARAQERSHATTDAFLTWTCGASLLGHTATCISVAYFDQSIAFLYLTIVACVASGNYADGMQDRIQSTPATYVLATRGRVTRRRAGKAATSFGNRLRHIPQVRRRQLPALGPSVTASADTTTRRPQH
jgi:hypothetical protein